MMVETFLKDLIADIKKTIPNHINAKEKQPQILRNRYIYVPIYNTLTFGGGIGIRLRDCKKKGDSWEGGSFTLYGVALNNEKEVIKGFGHTCRTKGGYLEALMTVCNIIDAWNSGDMTSANFRLMPHTVIAISEAEKELGIKDSPIKENVYQTLKESLNECLIGVRDSNYRKQNFFALGGILKNLLNLTLSKSEKKEIFSMLDDKKLLPLLKEIKGDSEMMVNDGMKRFPKELHNLIDYIKKDSSDKKDNNNEDMGIWTVEELEELKKERDMESFEEYETWTEEELQQLSDKKNAGIPEDMEVWTEEELNELAEDRNNELDIPEWDDENLPKCPKCGYCVRKEWTTCPICGCSLD